LRIHVHNPIQRHELQPTQINMKASYKLLSTMTLCLFAQASQADQTRSLRSVAASPTTTNPRFARVSATFSRLASAKKPTLPLLLLRTALNITTSFSRP
jgi:hypothetical protein